jgi:hypothetical protein
MSETRSLTQAEARLLHKILQGSGASEMLVEQIQHARVTGDSTATFLRLAMRGGQPASGVRDGPLTGRYPVGNQGQVLGEIIIWLRGGWLAGVEFAWVTDASPAGMPNADDVTVEVSA